MKTILNALSPKSGLTTGLMGVLALLLSCFQFGCGLDCGASRITKGMDATTGVRIESRFYGIMGDGFCIRGNREITITSPSGQEYKAEKFWDGHTTQPAAFSESDSASIAALFPDLSDVHNAAGAIVLRVDPGAGGDILYFHDGSLTGVILAEKVIPWS